VAGHSESFTHVVSIPGALALSKIGVGVLLRRGLLLGFFFAPEGAHLSLHQVAIHIFLLLGSNDSATCCEDSSIVCSSGRFAPDPPSLPSLDLIDDPFIPQSSASVRPVQLSIPAIIVPLAQRPFNLSVP